MEPKIWNHGCTRCWKGKNIDIDNVQIIDPGFLWILKELQMIKNKNVSYLKYIGFPDSAEVVVIGYEILTNESSNSDTKSIPSHRDKVLE